MITKGQTRWDRRAAHYDESPHQTGFFQPLHDLTLREACCEMPRPQAVLDLGCGTGQFLLRAVEAFPDAELVGVDASSGMIQAAQSAAPRLKNVRFLQAFAEGLPLSDSAFDLAVTTASFHHWADQRLGLAEVHRVLRQGGIFILADILGTGVLRLGWLAWFVGRLDGGRINKPAVLDAMLQNTGFRVVRRTPVPHFARVAQVTVCCRL
jgi:ubiquinone/menaquinone biosynthesis C-methylase UbiE